MTEIPGTTRDIIEVPLAIGGVPFVLTDTAGLRDTDDRVERIGIGRAHGELASADMLLWLGEPDAAPEHRRVILVHSKADQADSCERARTGRSRCPLVTRAGINALIGADRRAVQVATSG